MDDLLERFHSAFSPPLKGTISNNNNSFEAGTSGEDRVNLKSNGNNYSNSNNDDTSAAQAAMKLRVSILVAIRSFFLKLSEGSQVDLLESGMDVKLFQVILQGLYTDSAGKAKSYYKVQIAACDAIVAAVDVFSSALWTNVGALQVVDGIYACLAVANGIRDSAEVEGDTELVEIISSDAMDSSSSSSKGGPATYLNGSVEQDKALLSYSAWCALVAILKSSTPELVLPYYDALSSIAMTYLSYGLDATQPYVEGNSLKRLVDGDYEMMSSTNTVNALGGVGGQGGGDKLKFRYLALDFFITVLEWQVVKLEAKGGVGSSEWGHQEEEEGGGSLVSPSSSPPQSRHFKNISTGSGTTKGGSGDADEAPPAWAGFASAADDDTADREGGNGATSPSIATATATGGGGAGGVSGARGNNGAVSNRSATSLPNSTTSRLPPLYLSSSSLHSLLPITYRMLCDSNITEEFRNKVSVLLWNVVAILSSDAIPSVANFVETHLAQKAPAFRAAGAQRYATCFSSPLFFLYSL
jgi:hypothetical protein